MSRALDLEQGAVVLMAGKGEHAFGTENQGARRPRPEVAQSCRVGAGFKTCCGGLGRLAGVSHISCREYSETIDSGTSPYRSPG